MPGWQAFVALGAIVLAVTGAEALYADMGHFGRTPIRLAWFGLVLPGLVLNYFGQGALVLRDPAALEHPFYHLVPGWALWPLIGLATCATIIASQAVISGVFSLTRQAVQLGYLPRMTVKHTSATEIGQIYIPRVNWLLMVGVLLLVFELRLLGQPRRRLWHLGHRRHGDRRRAGRPGRRLALGLGTGRGGWSSARSSCIDFAYFAANALKIPSGGWFPLAVAAAFAYFVVTWRRGRRVLWDKLYGHQPAVAAFIAELDPALIRVPGTAVYMTGNPDVVPTALLHNIEHNQVLHEQIVLMTVRTQDIPYVAEEQRVEVEALDAGFFRVIVSYGFLDQPDVPRALALCRAHGLAARPDAGLVLHRPRDADSDPQPADGAGRGARVYGSRRGQPVGHRLLQDPAGAGRGTRNPARGLKRLPGSARPRRLVSVRGAEVRLSNKEWDILRLLVVNAGKVLTQRAIMQEVWGPKVDVQYLKIYVRQLRQKLDCH